MKTVSLAIFFSCLLNLLFSQTLKRYQGNFKTNNNTGVANYTYIENAAFERIFQGNFSFSSTNKLFKISGQFQNDKKNGLWQYLANNFTEPKFVGNGVNKVSFNITGNYNAGDMEGNWIFERIVNTSRSTIMKENSIVNFKHNHLIGNFSFSFRYSSTDRFDLINQQYLTIKGAFDDVGNKTGTWVLNSLSNGIKYENISKYSNDALDFSLIRNISTGEILYKVENAVVSTKSTHIDNLDKVVDGAIDFWTKPTSLGAFYFYSGFQLAASNIFVANPIFEITRGSKIGEDGRLLW